MVHFDHDIINSSNDDYTLRYWLYVLFVNIFIIEIIINSWKRIRNTPILCQIIQLSMRDESICTNVSETLIFWLNESDDETDWKATTLFQTQNIVQTLTCPLSWIPLRYFWTCDNVNPQKQFGFRGDSVACCTSCRFLDIQMFNLKWFPLFYTQSKRSYIADAFTKYSTFKLNYVNSGIQLSMECLTASYINKYLKSENGSYSIIFSSVLL